MKKIISVSMLCSLLTGCSKEINSDLMKAASSNESQSTAIIVVDKDFYVAKNIGVVENIQTALFPSSSTTTTKITGYTIK